MTLKRWTAFALPFGLTCLGIGVLVRESNSPVVAGIIYAGMGAFLVGVALMVWLIAGWGAGSAAEAQVIGLMMLVAACLR